VGYDNPTAFTRNGARRDKDASMETFNFKANDGVEIASFKWVTPKPKAVVQIVHGMAEHAARYAHVAEKLNQAGFSVYANDHRGHGKTAREESDVGHFADADGWHKVIADLHQLNRMARDENAGVPVIMLGHSMGSFLTQHMMFAHASDVDAAILSGSNGSVGILGIAAKGLAAAESLRLGPKGKSKIIDQASFGAFNNAFKPARTKFDWLSRDPKAVDAYVNDPRCGFLCTNQFWRDLLDGLSIIDNPANQARVRKDLPLYIFSGSRDPVSKGTKTLQPLIDGYRKLGLSRMHSKFYPDARHETLNETNKDEVISDLVEWIRSTVR
jgi:alpha-beta hydrolase superfamily lysophospholipase